MPTKVFQNNFNSGELSEKAQARVKIARYENGCDKTENGIILPVGGFTRRPGWRYAKETKDSATKDSVLIPYDAGDDETFMLEFGDLYMRVFDAEGNPINSATGSNLITNGDFPAGITGWTDKSTGGGVFSWLSAEANARLEANTFGDVAWFEQSITTVIGKTYEITFDKQRITSGAFSLLVGTTTGGAEIGETVFGVGSHTIQFVATATTTYIGFKQEFQTDNLGGDLVLNGDFPVNLAGWTDNSNFGFVWHNSGGMRSEGTLLGGANQWGAHYQGVVTVIGERYRLSWDRSTAFDPGGTSYGQVKIGTTIGGAELFSKSYTGGGTSPGEETTFVATTTTTYIEFGSWQGTGSVVSRSDIWDNIVMRNSGFGSTVDNVTTKVTDTPFELVTTITEAMLESLQYAQLENGMLLTSNQIKLQHLVPVSPSDWSITLADWAAEKLITGATGTNIGDMTTGGGLAAAFDADTTKTTAQACSTASGTKIGTVGKDWGAGTPKTLKGVNLWSSSNGSFCNEVGAEVNIQIQASDDNFSTQTVVLAETLFNVESISLISKLEIFNLNDTRTPYRYHRVRMESKVGAALVTTIAALEFFESIAENPPGLNDSALTYAPAIGRFNQRSITGGQTGRAATVYGTVSGEPLNMDQGEANDADAFIHELDQTGSIRWFIDSDDLLVGTSQGVTRLRGTQGPLTASDKEARADVSIGAAPIRPAKMGNAALYIQTDRQRVQEVVINDQGVKLIASDMNSIADHIGDTELGGSRFKGFAAQPDPNKVLWCYLDNGKMVGLTYNRQESLFAWHQHPVDNGVIISMASLRGADGRTKVWSIIKRTIDGADKRSVEIMDPTVYSDGAVKYSGIAATTITKLDHLEGETVSVYGDGYNRGTFVVTGGQIILPDEDPMSVGDIGLGFIPKLVPVTPIRGIGRKRRFGPVKVKVENTQSLWVNGKRQSFRKGSDPLTQGVKFTGIKRVTALGWKEEPKLTFEGREPGPFTILGYTGFMEIGR